MQCGSRSTDESREPGVIPMPADVICLSILAKQSDFTYQSLPSILVYRVYSEKFVW